MSMRRVEAEAMGEEGCSPQNNVIHGSAIEKYNCGTINKINSFAKASR